MILRIVSILFFLLFTISGIAQPTLPNIAGSLSKGTVTLTWSCQYDAIRTIAVFRSADSISNYTLIGNVNKTDKGVQVFADNDPLAGRNYYKLSVRFSSGLAWSSNHIGVYVPDSMLRPAAGATDVMLPAEIDNMEDYDSQNLKRTSVSVAFDPDTAKIRRLTRNNAPAHHRHNITISPGEPSENSATLVRSRFIFVDPVSGHINMTLPTDVRTRNYSIKFYDRTGKMIIEVPRINAPAIIIEKRNFRRKGVYKFVLRREIFELETGYIMVDPSL